MPRNPLNQFTKANSFGDGHKRTSKRSRSPENHDSGAKLSSSKGHRTRSLSVLSCRIWRGTRTTDVKGATFKSSRHTTSGPSGNQSTKYSKSGPAPWKGDRRGRDRRSIQRARATRSPSRRRSRSRSEIRRKPKALLTKQQPSHRGRGRTVFTGTKNVTTLAEDPSRLHEPLQSFRCFVLSKTAADVDSQRPEDLVAEYKKYAEDHKQRSLQVYWEAHKENGLLRDRFHPSHLLRSLEWRLAKARHAADDFLQKLKAGDFAKLKLSVALESSAVRPEFTNGLVFMEVEALQPSFALDATVHSFALEALPPALSVWQLFDEFKQLPGFRDVVLRPPDVGQLDRTGHTFFENADALENATSKVCEMTIAGVGIKPVPTKEAPNQRRVLVAQMPRMNAELLDAVDKVLRALDASVGLNHSDEVFSAISAAASNLEANFDLHLLYLRWVHHCCFFSGTWSTNAHDFIQHCGVAVSRTEAPAESEVALKDELVKCAQLLLDQAKVYEKQRISLQNCSSVEEEPLKSRWMEHCEKGTEKVNEDRYRCQQCHKLFKGPEFVHKHILKVHTEDFQRIVDDIFEDRMKSAFFEDAFIAKEAQASIKLSSKC